MGSDFRPHGCDPMGSAVGITPRVSLALTTLVRGGCVDSPSRCERTVLGGFTGVYR